MIDIRLQSRTKPEDDLYRVRDLKNHKDLFKGSKHECLKWFQDYKLEKLKDRFEDENLMKVLKNLNEL